MLSIRLNPTMNIIWWYTWSICYFVILIFQEISELLYGRWDPMTIKYLGNVISSLCSWQGGTGWVNQSQTNRLGYYGSDQTVWSGNSLLDYGSKLLWPSKVEWWWIPFTTFFLIDSPVLSSPWDHLQITHFSILH